MIRIPLSWASSASARSASWGAASSSHQPLFHIGDDLPGHRAYSFRHIRQLFWQGAEEK
jgi:hypothetical protein